METNDDIPEDKDEYNFQLHKFEDTGENNETVESIENKLTVEIVTISDEDSDIEEDGEIVAVVTQEGKVHKICL